MPRSIVTPEVKAHAIADLLTGDQPAVVAARYDVPGATVRQWKARLVTPAVTEDSPVTATVTSVIRRPTIEVTQHEIGVLVLENLRAKLMAAQAIAEYVQTEAWLQKQNAADMADIFDAIDRSSVVMLDRLAGRADPAQLTDADE